MNKQRVIKKSPTSHQQHLINKPSKSNQKAINKFPFAPSAGIVALSLVNPVASAASAPISRTLAPVQPIPVLSVPLYAGVTDTDTTLEASARHSVPLVPVSYLSLEFLRLRKAIHRWRRRTWQKEAYINPGVQRFEDSPEEALAEPTQAPTKRVRR